MCSYFEGPSERDTAYHHTSQGRTNKVNSSGHITQGELCRSCKSHDCAEKKHGLVVRPSAPQEANPPVPFDPFSGSFLRLSAGTTINSDALL